VSLGVAKRRPIHLHDLTMLYYEVKGHLKLSNEISDNLGELSAYYALARYPNAGLTRPSIGISRLQAERAIATGRRVLKKVEETLTSAKSG
jgi:HEPN domain-containing protein